MGGAGRRGHCWGVPDAHKLAVLMIGLLYVLPNEFPISPVNQIVTGFGSWSVSAPANLARNRQCEKPKIII